MIGMRYANCYLLLVSILKPFMPLILYLINHILHKCEGYDINSPTDWVRRLWRQHFAEATSPFNSFTRDFAPDQRPNIIRQTTFSENYYFAYNDVAVFGLNRVSGDQYVDDVADPDVNAVWVTKQLAADTSPCSLKSIVLVGHKPPSSDVNSALNAYFSTCGTLPTLTISGNAHPKTYCMDRNAKITERVDLTVEAFEAGPLRVSVVRDENGKDYFHIRDTDLVNSNSNCPQFDVKSLSQSQGPETSSPSKSP